MRHLTEATCRIRLACVRHAASVRSEPGSNSPLALLPSLSRAAPATRLPLSCVGSSLLRTSSTQRTNTTSTHHCRTSHLSAHPRVSRLGSTPSLFLSSLFYRILFFSNCFARRHNPVSSERRTPPRAREGTLLACPRTLDKGSSPAHTCFCQALSTKFSKNYIYFLNHPLLMGKCANKNFLHPTFKFRFYAISA